MTTTPKKPATTTTTPKFKEGDHVSATVYGTIEKNHWNNELSFVITDVDEDQYYMKFEDVENLKIAKTPAQRVNLPTKVGSIIITDPNNDNCEFTAYLRTSNKSEPWSSTMDSSTITYTDEEVAKLCLAHGHLVVK